MLKDDIVDHGYVSELASLSTHSITDRRQIFRISLYFAREGSTDRLSHLEIGESGRVFAHTGRMELDTLLKALMGGRCGDSFEDSKADKATKERGKLLVTSKFRLIFFRLPNGVLIHSSICKRKRS